jgi:hypothetical protein
MSEKEFKLKVELLFDQYSDCVTNLAGGKKEWVKRQLELAYSNMPMGWNFEAAAGRLSALRYSLEGKRGSQ